MILIFDHDQKHIDRMKVMLGAFADRYKLHFCTEPEETQAMLLAGKADIFVCDTDHAVIGAEEMLEFSRTVAPDTVRILLTRPLDVREVLDIIRKCDCFAYIIRPVESQAAILQVMDKAISFIEARKKTEGSIRILAEERRVINSEIEDGKAALEAVRAQYSSIFNTAVAMLMANLKSNETDKNTDLLVSSYEGNLWKYMELFMKEWKITDFTEAIIKEFSLEKLGKLVEFGDLPSDMDENSIKTLYFATYVMANYCRALLKTYSVKVDYKSVKSEVGNFYLLTFTADPDSYLKNDMISYRYSDTAAIDELRRISNEILNLLCDKAVFDNDDARFCGKVIIRKK